MSPRKSKVNMRDNLQQNTGEIQIHFETGEKYRPYTCVQRIESIDAKKKSKTDPRLYTVAKDVPLEQLSVFSVNTPIYDQVDSVAPSTGLLDLVPEENKLEFVPDMSLDGSNAGEHDIQIVEGEWSASAESCENSVDTSLKFGPWNLEHMGFPYNEQIPDNTQPQCDGVQSYWSIGTFSEMPNDDPPYTDTHPCFPPGLDDEKQYFAHFVSSTPSYDGDGTFHTDLISSSPVDDDCSFYDYGSPHERHSPVQSELSTPLDRYFDNSCTIGDPQNVCVDLYSSCDPLQWNASSGDSIVFSDPSNYLAEPRLSDSTRFMS